MKRKKILIFIILFCLCITGCGCNKSFTVTFESNGGSEVESQKVEKGGTVSVPQTPTRDGYNFVAWYLNGFEYDFNTPVESDITLSASWQEGSIKTYTVKFDSNGGSSVSSQTIKEGNKVQKPNDPTRKNYKFLGWYLNNKKYDFSKTVTSNITLEAKWESTSSGGGTSETKKEYTVTFNSNGNSFKGEASVVTRKCTADSSGKCTVTCPVIVAATTTPTVIGYSQGAKVYEKDSSYNSTNNTITVTGNKTYYAQTKKDSVTYTINFKQNGSNTSDVTKTCKTPVIYNGASASNGCSITSPTLVGSTNTPIVIGYSTNKDGHNNEWGSNTSKTVSSNQTYYAQTKKDAVTLNIYYQTTTGVSSIGKTSDKCTLKEVYNGASQATSCSVTLPTIKVSNATSKGWYRGETSVGSPGDSYTMTTDTTLITKTCRYRYKLSVTCLNGNKNSTVSGYDYGNVTTARNACNSSSYAMNFCIGDVDSKSCTINEKCY